ncbi:MAG: amino acid ABC transporter ATP-binding protein [Lachnospiraceae bacterium]|nr:amino acid ABC transporter ATP-binding protein [Lachnospiraceae bacterium]
MPVLTVTNLKKSFGANEILKGIDISVEKGDVISIIGPSGGGKTTLLRCMNFLETADDGNLTFDGRTYSLPKMTKKEAGEIRKKTGFVFQSYNLFANKTALQNVTQGLITVQKKPKAEAEKIGMEMLERVNMKDRANYFPAQLSGGQQQRVAIARALAADPEIIYFDEPTSALDPELIGEVLRVMRDLAEGGLTMLVVTHEMSFARDVSKRTIFMEGGVIVEEGPSKELFSHPENARTAEFIRNISS